MMISFKKKDEMNYEQTNSVEGKSLRLCLDAADAVGKMV
jgi:hypothetical protein